MGVVTTVIGFYFRVTPSHAPYVSVPHENNVTQGVCEYT